LCAGRSPVSSSRLLELVGACASARMSIFSASSMFGAKLDRGKDAGESRRLCDRRWGSTVRVNDDADPGLLVRREQRVSESAGKTRRALPRLLLALDSRGRPREYQGLICHATRRFLALGGRKMSFVTEDLGLCAVRGGHCHAIARRGQDLHRSAFRAVRAAHAPAGPRSGLEMLPGRAQRPASPGEGELARL